jgi:hypothetical protein
VEVGRRAGLRQRLSDHPRDEPLASFIEQIAGQGFDPSVRRRGDVVDVTLQVCPFTSAVLTDPDTVCGLHLGIARGMAEALGGIEVDELAPRDPRRAHCRLRCRLTGSPSGTPPDG